MARVGKIGGDIGKGEELVRDVGYGRRSICRVGGYKTWWRCACTNRTG